MGQKGLPNGKRAVANWDEDAVTMAVEAARDCLCDMDRNKLAGVWMASTSFPFRDRQNAGIVADAFSVFLKYAFHLSLSMLIITMLLIHIYRVDSILMVNFDDGIKKFKNE